MEKAFNKGSKNPKKDPKISEEKNYSTEFASSFIPPMDIRKEYLETGSNRYCNIDRTSL